MFGGGQVVQLRNYEKIEEVPIDQYSRSCTDVFCTIIGILFSLALIIVALSGMNHQKYVLTNFPADSQGRLCGVDLPAYPYLYFARPPEIARRVCTASCPEKGDKKLDCTPTDNIGCRFTNTAGFEMDYYQTESVGDRNGLFCYPTNSKIREELLYNSNLANRQKLMHSLDAILISAVIALGVSVIYLLLVQFLPEIMNKAAVILGTLTMIALLVCIATYNTPYVKSKWVAFSIFLIIVIITIVTVIFNWRSLTIHGMFLREATFMVCDQITTISYIPLFIILAIGFSFLLIYEFKNFWMYGDISFNAQTSLYHELSGFVPWMLFTLWFIQLVWGFTFLKEAFNFCVSGNAVEWYYGKDQSCFYPLKLLVCKHFGSVVAGAFMVGFFSIGDYFFDFLKPSNDNNPDGFYNKFFTSTFGCCFRTFQLIRSDAMAYVYLTGNPYCNSARYCEYLCNQSLLLDESQSSSRAYRICSHFLLATIVAIIALYLKGGISVYVIAFIVALSIFISTFFISLHADAAEAIQIIFMQDQEFHKRSIEQRDHKFDRNDIHTGLSVNMKKELADLLRQERLEQMERRSAKNMENKDSWF